MLLSFPRNIDNILEIAMITITGATGALNGATVDHLLARMPAKDITVVARDVAKAQRFADVGVTVRRGAYDDVDSLTAAFDGADQILLVSSSDPGADAVSLHASAIAAAAASGAKRILYTSHQGAALDNPFRPAQDHARTEQLLAESGVAWTALRNGFYAHSLPWLMGAWRDSHSIVVPADGAVSWTSRDDVAEAAAIILASDGGYDGPVTLTASAALTFDDVAGIATEILSTEVTRIVVDPDEWIATQVATGTPEFLARFTLGIFLGAESGKLSGTDPLLANLLGRDPRTVRDALNDPPMPAGR
jgi:NAD(P)H dehydrogenase (quinone)